MRHILYLVFLLAFSLTAKSKTIAISYFDNNSNNPRYISLSKGIADMLITDLSKVKGIIIVERSRLDQIIKEIKLQESKFFNPQTAQKLGKGLGADYILTGSFTTIGNMIRIDARLINVASGVVEFSEEATGDQKDFFSIHKKLAQVVGKSMNFDYSKSSMYAKNQRPVSLNTVTEYSNALDLNDKGLRELAEKLLTQTTQKEPGFLFADEKLMELKKWLVTQKKSYDSLLRRKTEKQIAGLNFNNPDEDLFNQVQQIIRQNGNKYASNSVELCNMLLSLKVDFGNDPYRDNWWDIMYNKFYAFLFLRQYDSALYTGKQYLKRFEVNPDGHARGFDFESINKEVKEIVDRKLKEEAARKTISLRVFQEQLEALIQYIDDIDGDISISELQKPAEFNSVSYLFAMDSLEYSKRISFLFSEINKINIDNLTRQISGDGQNEIIPLWVNYHKLLDRLFYFAAKFQDIFVMKSALEKMKTSLTKLNLKDRPEFENWDDEIYRENFQKEYPLRIEDVEKEVKEFNNLYTYYSYDKLIGESSQDEQDRLISRFNFSALPERWDDQSYKENQFVLERFKFLARTFHIHDLNAWRILILSTHFRDGSDSSSFYLNRLKADSSYFNESGEAYQKIIISITKDLKKIDQIQKHENYILTLGDNYYPFLLASNKSHLYRNLELKIEEISTLEEVIQYNRKKESFIENLRRLKDLYIETGSFNKARTVFELLFSLEDEINTESLKREMDNLPIE